MGNSKSKSGTGATNDLVPISLKNPGEALTPEQRYLLERKPTAAVIGGGLPGLHTAFTLQQSGFDVTLFESKKDVAQGSILCSKNYINGPFHADSYSFRLSTATLMPIISFAKTGIYPLESNFFEVFSHKSMYWLKARLMKLGDRSDVIAAGNMLGEKSAQIYREMGAADPRLQECLTETTFPPHRRIEGDIIPEVSEKEDKKYLLVHPEKWTKRLKEILIESGVKFKTQHQVLSVGCSVVQGQEAAKSVAVDDFNEMREVMDNTIRSLQPTRHHYNFDIFVLAAGASSSDISYWTHSLPLFGCKGYALRQKLADSSWAANIFPGATPLNLNYFSTGIGASGLLHASFVDDVVTVFGLGTFSSEVPSAKKATDVATIAKRFKETYPSINKATQFETEASKVQGWGRNRWQRQEAALPSDDCTIGAEYVRSFTPDGLPIIGRMENTYNYFVCAGFGDDELRWAPAAGVLLRQFILRKEVDTKESNPYSLERFGLFTPDRNLIGTKVTSDAESSATNANDIAMRFYKGEFSTRAIMEIHRVTDAMPGVGPAKYKFAEYMDSFTHPFEAFESVVGPVFSLIWGFTNINPS